MLGITDFYTFILGTVVILLTPGPNTIFCLTMSAYSVKMAYRAVLGILLGNALLILMTVLGAGTVLKLYPSLFLSIKIIGCAYLSYLGTKLITKAIKYIKFSQLEINPKAVNPIEQKHIFQRALFLSLTNLSAIFFFLSFFIQFVNPQAENPTLSFFILACVYLLFSFCYLNLLIFVGNNIINRFKKFHKFSALMIALVGVLFISFAVKLWFVSL